MASELGIRSGDASLGRGQRAITHCGYFGKRQPFHATEHPSDASVGRQAPQYPVSQPELGAIVGPHGGRRQRFQGRVLEPTIQPKEPQQSGTAQPTTHQTDSDLGQPRTHGRRIAQGAKLFKPDHKSVLDDFFAFAAAGQKPDGDG